MSEELKRLGDDILLPHKDRWISTYGGALGVAKNKSELAFQREVTAFQNKVFDLQAKESLKPESVLNTWLDIAAIGLSVADAEVYLIPYKGELTCQVGYQGKLRVINRAPGCSSTEPVIVYSKDELDFSGFPPVINHYRRNVTEGEKPLSVIWRIETPNGPKDFQYTYQELLDYKKHSKMKWLWDGHEKAMIQKTMVNKAYKYLRPTLPDELIAIFDQTLQDEEINESIDDTTNNITIITEDEDGEGAF